MLASHELAPEAADRVYVRLMAKSIKLPDSAAVKAAVRKPLIAFTFLSSWLDRSDPVNVRARGWTDDEFAAQGWRYVGSVDERGNRLYAPPPQDSRWKSWP